MLPEVLTTSWSDGTPGPIAYCLPEGKLSGAEMAEYNCAHRGKSWVMSSGTSSHFMSGECFAVMLEQLISPALEIQRQR